MFQTVSSYFGSIPFFSTPFFGITAMVLVGTSWCLVGLVMGEAPKCGVKSEFIQLFGNVFASLVALLMIFGGSAGSNASFKATLLTMLAYGTGGALNFCMLQLMAKAMQCGPNGIIWSIIQSAFIFPFLGGVIFFDVKLSWFRGVGIAVLLIALFLFAGTKDNGGKSTGNRWKYLAFLALGLTGIQQNLTTLPSYFPEAHGVSSALRVLAASLGAVSAAAIWMVANMTAEYRQCLKINIKSWMLWKYVLLLQAFALFFSYIFFYPGLDVMAANGMGAMGYPLMVGSCLVSFSLTSIFYLKEKLDLLQLAALSCCIGGLILVCTPV